MMNDKNPPHKRWVRQILRTVSQHRSIAKIPNPSIRAILCVSESSPLSSRLLTNFLSTLSPSSMSATSKTSSLSSSTLKIKKRLILDSPQAKKKAHRMDILKTQEPKLAAYEVDWFNSTSTKNKCLKHTSKHNLPVTQEGQITFLLNKYLTSTSRQRSRMQLARLAQPRENFSTHFLIVKISSFIVFLSWFMAESP